MSTATKKAATKKAATKPRAKKKAAVPVTEQPVGVDYTYDVIEEPLPVLAQEAIAKHGKK